jgi:hypothetical protein
MKRSDPPQPKTTLSPLTEDDLDATKKRGMKSVRISPGKIVYPGGAIVGGIAGIPIDVVFQEWSRQSERKQRLEALRLRGDWRKADIQRLLCIGVEHPAQQRIARLLGEKSSGRGVVAPPKDLATQIADRWEICKQLFDPATPKHIRREAYKKSPLWPYLIEAAYRGELECLGGAKTRTTSPHLTLSARAKDNVAMAAGISAAKVHQLCQQVRGRSSHPASTAAQLRQRLERGELAKLGKVPDFK